MLRSATILLFLICTLSFSSCEKPEEITQIQEYQGPFKEAEDVELYHTELTKVRTKVIASVVWEYKDGNREFPEGMFIEFYDENGKVTSDLRSDKAYFNKADNLWRGVGDVQVRNVEKGQQLNTEELFWKPNQEKIFTDKFVRITEGDQVLYGTGLEAKQDFSSWFIKNVEGEFYLNEEE